MNPLTNMKNVKKLSEQELYTGNKTSWHDQYRDSAWVFIGGLPFDLTEGDIICIFSQYGEVVNINLIRDKDSGKSKGFCFLCYEDQRSTDLAVDNFNGIKILNRTIRVDHVSNYKVPKQGKKTDAETKKLYDEGCAPKAVPVQVPVKAPVKIKTDPDDFRETLADQINSEIKLPERLPIYTIKKEKVDEEAPPEPVVTKEKKEKKHKKEKKKKKKKKSDENSSESDSDRKKKKKKKGESGSDYSAEDSVSEDEDRRKRSRSPNKKKR
ncbi:RNA-binding motif protein, X-linked 2 [Tribolium castaneum]|uniref:RNA-binding motif protein, X-linked 2-like Protein n=1 Tax=Tribolium castaneum TaxID=7070 RepID=D6WSD7_TRICA|nr:PREDICTED: RNA-binding motif protein, X-linked 2 [Tribolium castaneum]EFA06628.1 RNA-binding motif protein, X-linked 2-like Protein [Tribolium castaneum]|eukprot:XP_972080.1 PREDICTED: RNA-binding motif protein, X-linked 2 [Tribolium castaneum]